MEIYLVGGAVRDQLLGKVVNDRDWVVVGSTVEDMLEQGYTPVGKDFPVFLHPDSKEEYALARTERKVSKGYKGFTFNSDPSISLEQDLQRRDLTINAIAQTLDGRFIDPFNGEKDIDDKILRHVSPAFSEDPVRILRVARFAASLPDFSVHPSTYKLMEDMVEAGEVDALVAERVWQEFHKALDAVAPERFFTVIDECCALPILFPELTNKEKYQQALQQAKTLTPNTTIRFAAICYALTATDVSSLCERMRAPTIFRELALLVVNQHQQYKSLNTDDAETVVTFLENIDALRRPERLAGFVVACQANQPKQELTTVDVLQNVLSVMRAVDPQQFVAEGLVGADIAVALHSARVEAVKMNMAF